MEEELRPYGVRVQAVLPGATRTEIWGRAGVDIDAALPSEVIMEVDEMVDAALGRLRPRRSWSQFSVARRPGLGKLLRPHDWRLGPNLSRNHAAARYKVTA